MPPLGLDTVFLQSYTSRSVAFDAPRIDDARDIHYTIGVPRREGRLRNHHGEELRAQLYDCAKTVLINRPPSRGSSGNRPRIAIHKNPHLAAYGVSAVYGVAPLYRRKQGPYRRICANKKSATGARTYEQSEIAPLSLLLLRGQLQWRRVEGATPPRPPDSRCRTHILTIKRR